MNNEKALIKIKEIKRKINLVKALAVILAVGALLFIPINFGIRIVIGLVIILAEKILLIKIKNTSVNILYRDCDPQTYYTVCHGIYPKQSTAYFDALAAYFTGDFQAAAELFCSLLQSKSGSLLRLDCLNLLAASAFLSGDFELCREICEKARSFVMNKKGKEEVKACYYSRYDFFNSFMNCDYTAALKHLDVCKTAQPTKQTNSYKFMMHYYAGITLYYSNKTSEARAEFESIINGAPQFYIFGRAKAYVNAIDSHTFLPIESISLKDACEKGKQQPLSKQIDKKQLIISSAVLIILIVIAVISIMQIPGIEKGTAYEVIGSDNEISEICETLPVDENYTLAIFGTAYDEIGVAYLKNQGDNIYSYCISHTALPEIYLVEDNGYYINASGETQKIYFDITDNISAVPPDSEVTEFEYNGKTYYFYIFKREITKNFANGCGINMD